MPCEPTSQERALGRANPAPTRSVIAVVRDRYGDRRAVLGQVGLAPAWAKLRGGPSLINTRDDKLASSGAWKPLVRSAGHRALIVADGYYEWQEPEDPKQPKQPFCHRLADGQPFAFAGLWAIATPKDAEDPITSCSIITTAANDDVRFVHDRMPVILNGSDAEAAWLDPDVDLEGALELVRPLPAGLLEVYPISARVNNPRNQGVELTEPLQAGRPRDRLSDVRRPAAGRRTRNPWRDRSPDEPPAPRRRARPPHHREHAPKLGRRVLTAGVQPTAELVSASGSLPVTLADPVPQPVVLREADALGAAGARDRCGVIRHRRRSPAGGAGTSRRASSSSVGSGAASFEGRNGHDGVAR